MKDEHKAVASKVFAAYKNKSEVHITSDNQAFFEKHHADGHSQTLKDRDVVTITREDLEEKPEVAAEQPADEPKKDEPKKDEPKKDEAKKDEPKKDEPKAE